MKISHKNWCKIQEAMINLSCPTCGGKLVTLKDTEHQHNAHCDKCGCQFEFNPDVDLPIGQEESA